MESPFFVIVYGWDGWSGGGRVLAYFGSTRHGRGLVAYIYIYIYISVAYVGKGGGVVVYAGLELCGHS